MEVFLLCSSVALVVLGSLALVLSLIFRHKSRRLDALPRDLAPTMFDRTFNVFNPYPDRVKVIHRFLTVLPLFAGVGAIGLGFGIWNLLSSGLILSMLVTIIGLNLIVIAEAPEIYANSTIFTKAIQEGTQLASGDVEVLKVVRKLLPKLGHYYLGLAMIFTAFSFTLQYLWDSFPYILASITNVIAQFSGSEGTKAVQAISIIFALNLMFLQYVAFRIKSRMFRYDMK